MMKTTNIALIERLNQIQTELPQGSFVYDIELDGIWYNHATNTVELFDAERNQAQKLQVSKLHNEIASLTKELAEYKQAYG